MTVTVQIFHYTVVEEKPIECLEEFKEHRRLKVFHQKGTKCVSCARVGTRLILGEKRGQLHWDVYTDDLYPITVDHIEPKVRGGSDDIGNLQPMCAECNKIKGCKNPVTIELNDFCKWPKSFIIVQPEPGIMIYKRNPQNKSKYKLLGRVFSITTNPVTLVPAFNLVDKPTSYHRLHGNYGVPGK